MCWRCFPSALQSSLFVFDLPSGGDEEMLLNLFSPYGRIDSVRVIRGPDGRGKGYGFVNMASWQDASAVRPLPFVVVECDSLLLTEVCHVRHGVQAVHALNGRKVGGCTLQVSFKR